MNSTGALIIGYAVTVDAAGRVTRINESPTNAVTTYQYDGAGRLLREERTVNRPYLGEYQYDASGNRTYARRVENGVETHRGTYTYDGAGRLIQVVDAATGVTENYVWNADGTLASFPGPGYTRLLEYDEEGRLIRIRRDYGGGNVQLAYEYAYGFDGGRRWRKDYINGVWTRYPCGVACGAGDLVEQQKPLEGGSWTTSVLYLQGISLVRRNGEWHHFDPLGTAGVITNSSASIISNNLYDVFGVKRYEQGSAETPWRWRGVDIAEEGFVSSEDVFVLPYIQIASAKLILPGIYIGVSICLILAWKDVDRDDFLEGVPVSDHGAVRHCYLCCRIVRCTLGLRPDLAYWLQVLWEVLQGEPNPLLNLDTQACIKGIGIGYDVWESCFTGCVNQWKMMRVKPSIVPPCPPRL